VNTLTESVAVFRRLILSQKLVLLRIFVVINIAAYFLATGGYFGNDWANTATVLAVYAMESSFMLWLGFKRGVGFHRAGLGPAGASAPVVQRGAGIAWHVGVMILSLLISAIVTVIVTNISDGDDLATFHAAIFLIVEALVMGLALLLGLRLGWNAVAVSNTASVPSLAGNGASGGPSVNGVIFPTTSVSSTAEEEAKAQRRAENVRRGQIVLGYISVICAVLAIYFHIVAHEMTKHDPEGDAAANAVMQALGDGTAPSAPTAVQAAVLEPSPINELPPDDPKSLWALQNAGGEGPNGEAIDSSTFPFATSSGMKSRDGYPIYLIECNAGSHQCVGETGQHIGSAAQVADTITPVRNADALRYHCPDWICVDPQGNVVGSVAPAMRSHLTQAH
jgi:hypothetical protein